MDKPKNYDITRVGNYERATIGAHIARIMSVEERNSASGRPMIVVYIDFDQEDSQAGLFARAYKDDTRDEKKWPNQATQYILTTDNEGSTNRSFKGFITAYEDSNGVEVKWVKDFGAQFKGKKVGVMYGDVEEEYNGQIRTRQKIRWFFDTNKIDEQETPPKKLYTGTLTTTSDAPMDWMEVGEAVGDELPFR